MEGSEAISPSQQNVLRVGLLSALMLVTRTRSRGTRRAVFPYVFRFMSMLRRGVVVPRTPTRISSVLRFGQPQRSVNSFDATWFPHLFRFEKTDFPVLLEALQIPAVVNTGGHSRVSCTGWDALGNDSASHFGVLHTRAGKFFLWAPFFSNILLRLKGIVVLVPGGLTLSCYSTFFRRSCALYFTGH